MVGSEMASDAGSVSSSGVKLKKELGLLEGVAVILGMIIGSGIFLTPATVLAKVGSVGVSLLVWVACGLLSMLGAACYAELGTTIPMSGANYAYMAQCFGPLPAFLYIWAANLIFVPVTNAVMGLTFGQYVLAPFLHGNSSDTLVIKLVAACSISLLTFINCYNVRFTARLQNTFMFTKLAALTLVIGIGLAVAIKGEGNSFRSAFDNVPNSPTVIAGGFYSGIFSYTGWNYLNYMTEELRDPYKNLPRAIYISLPLVTVIYVLANVAYLTVLTPAEMLSSNAIAVTFAEKTIGGFSWLMPVLVGFSSLGALGISILTSSRLCFVGARNGHLPDFMSMISIKYVTPIPTLLVLGALSLVYLIPGNATVLIDYGTFAETLFIMLPVVGMIYMRWKEPQRSRPIKVHVLLAVTFVVLCVFVIVMSCGELPHEIGAGTLITLSGAPVYYAFVNRHTRIRATSTVSGAFTRWCQKLFYAVKEE